MHRGQQPHLHAAAGSHPSHIQQQQRSSSPPRARAREAPGSARPVHFRVIDRVHHRIAQPEVETEDDAPGPAARHDSLEAIERRSVSSPTTTLARAEAERRQRGLRSRSRHPPASGRRGRAAPDREPASLRCRPGSRRGRRRSTRRAPRARGRPDAGPAGSPVTPGVSTESPARSGRGRPRRPARPGLRLRSSTGMSCMTHSTRNSPRPSRRSPIFGWDIGGANTKAPESRPPMPLAIRRVVGAARDGARLRLAGSDAAPAGKRARRRPEAHAVTMTAELSQAFRTKREGVEFVLDAMAEAFPGRSRARVRSRAARSSSPRGQTRPLEVGAANWHAAARFVGRDGARLHAARHRAPPRPTSFRSSAASR